MRNRHFVFILAALALIPFAASAADKVSRLGVYSGYSSADYDGFVRFSEYLEVRDGTRLAIDYFRPTIDGQLEDKPLPLIWTHTRYRRVNIGGGKVFTLIDDQPHLATLLQHGYIIAIVDVRGSGASFGGKNGWFPPGEARDAYDITEWFAAQSFADGNIGMFSRSYLGITQYFAASEAPPHLRAIFPEMAWFDMYDFLYPGGIFADWIAYSWGTVVRTWDRTAALPPNWKKVVNASNRATIADIINNEKCSDGGCVPVHGPAGRSVLPVDADTDGADLAAATAEHKSSPNNHSLAESAPYRDSELGDGIRFNEERSLYPRLAGLEESGVPAYHLNGWYDIFVKDALLWYRNYPNPQKIVIGPWYHTGLHPLDLGVEYQRWFDYWLKGIDNGVMDEEVFHYWTLGAPSGEEWRATNVWPLPNEQRTRFYLAAGPDDSRDSVNDGILTKSMPTGRTGADVYTVDYTTSVGVDNRWTQAVRAGGGMPLYSGLPRNERRGLTYTTDVLKNDVEVTGHPVVRLWVTLDTEDADFFVYLTELTADGESIYRTEGKMRASHRALSEPPYDNISLPYHRSYQRDLTAVVPGQPTELEFDLLPTSALFHAGSRLRVTITGADKDTYSTPVQSPAPTMTILHNAEHASYIELPIIPGGSKPLKLPTSELDRRIRPLTGID